MHRTAAGIGGCYIVEPLGAISRWVRAASVLAFLGATVGASLDVMHVATGTTSYPEPFVLGIAWWVFPLFASAGVAIGLARPLWERMLGLRSPRPSLAAAVMGVAFFASAYLVSGFVKWPWPERSVLLAAIFVVTWVVLDRTGLGIALAIGTAVIGTLIEIALVGLGVFSYVEHDFRGVAAWLPWLYATAAVGVGHLGKHLVDDG